MVNIWLSAAITIAVSVLISSIGCLLAYRKGCCVGSKTREKEILLDYVWYIPLGRIADFAEELMEDRGVSGDYPMLVIRSDKYDYLDDTDPEG